MRTINITYRRKLLFFHVTRKITSKVPQSWGELTPLQLESIINVVFAQNKEYIKRLMVAKFILEINWIEFFFLLPELDQLYPDSEGELHTLIKILTDFAIIDDFRQISITKNPFPAIKTGKILLKRSFFGPSDQLSGLTTAEFIIAETHFNDYINSQKTDDLNLFVATLYRPQGRSPIHDPRSSAFCGDRREDFNENTIEKRAKHFQKVRMTKKLGVLSFYRSCRQIWEKEFELVFNGKGEGNGYGWFEALKAVDYRDFGTIEDKEKVPIFNILMSMEIDMRNAKKQEAKK